MTISINQVWEDSVAFIRREIGLLLPLVLATLLVGDVILSLASAVMVPGGQNGIPLLAGLIGALWSIVGQLAIMALVLKGGTSVGEALRLGMQRLGKVMLAGIALGIVLTLVMVPLLVALVASGYKPATPGSLADLPPWASIYLVAFFALTIWLGARLCVLNPLLVDRNPPLFGAIRQAFSMTAGVGARLVGVILIYVVMLLVLGNAVRFVLGSLFSLIGGFLAEVLMALASGLVTTALALVAAVFVAMLYRRLSTGT